MIIQCKCKEQVFKSQDSVRLIGLFIDKHNFEKIVNSIIGKVNSRLKFYIETII